MQGVIDRMQAGVARIDELGVTLREIETGLIDFPALASGRQIWLCWRLGEGDVEWWHELERRVRRPAAAGRPGLMADGASPPRARRSGARDRPPGRPGEGLPAAPRGRPPARLRRRGLAAYERGDFFEAHELLEPAWMGTDDSASGRSTRA